MQNKSAKFYVQTDPNTDNQRIGNKVNQHHILPAYSVTAKKTAQNAFLSAQTQPGEDYRPAKIGSPRPDTLSSPHPPIIYNEVTGIPPKPIPPDRAGNIRSDLADNIVHQGFFGLPDGTRRYLRNSRRTTTGKWSDGVRAS